MCFFFSDTNLTEATGNCSEGYYCVTGADRPNPLMLNDSQCPVGTVHPIVGHSCPTGHYCPAGAILPIGCPAGTYQDIEAQRDCKPCPVGYYCFNTTSDFLPNICPGGYYCPIRSEQPYQYPCAAGTFNNLTSQHDIGACISCTAGMYCQGMGNPEPTGQCDPGWYCTNGSDTARVSMTNIYSLPLYRHAYFLCFYKVCCM